MGKLSVDPATATFTPPPSEVKWLPLDFLLGHVQPDNEKDHDIGDIMQSILRHGFVGFVTFDPSVPQMVAGHGRLKGLRALCDDGYDPPDRIIDGEGNQGWLVPTYEHVFASDHERTAYRIGDNQTTIKGGWLLDLLTDSLQNLATTDPLHGLDGTGYDMEDLDMLLADKNFEPPPPMPPQEIEMRFGIWMQVKDKVQENAVADLLEKHGWEKFRRMSDDG
jgi:hypothetical protein